MKKYLTFVICLYLTASLLAQEKYPVPVLTAIKSTGELFFNIIQA